MGVNFPHNIKLAWAELEGVNYIPVEMFANSNARSIYTTHE